MEMGSGRGREGAAIVRRGAGMGRGVSMVMGGAENGGPGVEEKGRLASGEGLEKSVEDLMEMGGDQHGIASQSQHDAQLDL